VPDLRPDKGLYLGQMHPIYC